MEPPVEDKPSPALKSEKQAPARSPDSRASAPGHRPPAEVLAGVKAPDPAGASQPETPDSADEQLVQEPRPLHRCLEWRLSAASWARDGLLPFVRSEVPHNIHNSGPASEHAAHVLFASMCESPPDGPYRVLELGAGLGLFARQLLDSFAALCRDTRRDFYEKLTYVITDGSARTVERWRSDELFADHDGHVECLPCDALDPAAALAAPGTGPAPPLRAVFANYILDSLPATLLRRTDGKLEELQLRTYLAATGEELARHRLDAQQVVDIVRSDDVEKLAALLPLLSKLRFEPVFAAADDELAPWADDLFADQPASGRQILNHGALACLDACAGHLDADGFMLISDYGPATTGQLDDISWVNRFGSTVAVCINFPHVEKQFSNRGWSVARTPADEAGAVHCRLLLTRQKRETVQAFVDRHADDRFTGAEQRATEANEHVVAGRLQDALTAFQAVLDVYPRDWNVLGLAAQFLNQQLLQHEQGLELVDHALRLNPWYSPFLWNTRGNCLYSLGRHDEAHECYETALGLDDRDSQTYLNLAYSLTQTERHAEALEAVARGLEHDTDHRYESALLQKQRKILETICDEKHQATLRLEQRNRAFNTRT